MYHVENGNFVRTIGAGRRRTKGGGDKVTEAHISNTARSTPYLLEANNHRSHHEASRFHRILSASLRYARYSRESLNYRERNIRFAP